MDKAVDYTQPQADRIVVELGELRGEVRDLNAKLDGMVEMLDALGNGQEQCFWAAGGTIMLNHNRTVFALAKEGEEVRNARLAAGPQIILPPGVEGAASA